MIINSRKGILPIFIALIVVGSLGLGAGGYKGVRFIQSGKLIKEGEKLMREGRYTDALAAFEKAGKKFGPTKKKIAPRIADAQELKAMDDNLIAGEESFGKGEWQKCLEYLGKVTPRYPNFQLSQNRYSDCQKKLDEANVTKEAEAKAAADAAAAQAQANATTATTKKSSGSTSKNTQQNSSSTSSSSGSSSTGSQTRVRPVLSLPFSGAIMPDSLMPMGETINHPKPQNPSGHPGIDFQWNNPTGTVEITASMDGTITNIRSNTTHAGTWDVATSNGAGYGVDYTELGGIREGLAVGNAVRVGDLIGYPQHPVNVTDQPNYKMLHWQFGYISENPDYPFVTARLCPLSFFTSGAVSTINSIWAATNWPEMKANAPEICSGDYAGRDS